MQELINHFLLQLGHIIYTLPAVFLLQLSREYIRNVFFLKVEKFHSHNPLYYTDGVAIGVYSLFGIGWGGILNSERADSIFSFFISQFWYIVVILLVFLYANLKQPAPDTYLAVFIAELMRASWVLFIFNFIPLPPFDAAFIYFQYANPGKLHKAISTVSKVLVILTGVLGVADIDFFNGQWLVNFLGIGGKAW